MVELAALMGFGSLYLFGVTIYLLTPGRRRRNR